jgi:Tfp pilus assembly ATPase PilU
MKTAGWHSFEQSLIKAYEADLITEETALLYCINKSAMHQRIDHIQKHRQTVHSLEGLKLKMDKKPDPVPAARKPPLVPPPEVPPPAA